MAYGSSNLATLYPFVVIVRDFATPVKIFMSNPQISEGSISTTNPYSRTRNHGQFISILHRTQRMCIGVTYHTRMPIETVDSNLIEGSPFY